MRKIAVIGISILSVFILLSLSYQPIIADTPIQPIPMAKESKTYNLDADEIKELNNKLIGFKSQSYDDCGCGDTTGWNFSIICKILEVPFAFGMILLIALDIKIIIGMTIILAEIFNCGWVW